jgi:putative addiction module killer protein
MLIEKRTAVFNKWFDELPINVQEVVSTYINRVKDGNTSNCKSVGGGVSEIKIHFQKGYRVYHILFDNNTIIFLLAGGDKKTQGKDIKLAKALMALLKKHGGQQ